MPKSIHRDAKLEEPQAPPPQSHFPSRHRGATAG
jgi:hypothetical protein